MKKLIRCHLLFLTTLLLTQCAGLGPKLHHCRAVLPGTSEPVMFQLKSVSGVARQSQIMAALEEVSAQMDRNAKSKKDPLARLASQYSPDADVALVIQGLSVDATRLNGTKITLLAPVITYAAQHVPDPVLTRALPDVQKYVFDQMSTRFKPVRASELRDTKN
jgi:hypothetical protein